MPIHPTAIVSPQAAIDPSTEIGPYVIIEDEVTIGPNCRIAAHVYINGNTRIGANNEIHAGAVLGDTPQDRAFQPCRSYLQIGDDNIIREFVSIHRGTAPESITRIGSGCFIMGYSHVGHNCRVGDGVTIANMTALAGHVEVGERAFVSGYTGVHQFVRIGRLCMIAGGSRVTMDLPPFLMAAHETEVVNVNLVGLRRADFSSEEIGEIRSAYRRLYRSGLTFRKALEELTAKPCSPLVQEMIDFINVPSKRGIAGPPDRRKEDREAETKNEK